MVLSVFLGIWNEDKLRRVKIDDVDIDANVQVLKPHLTKEVGDADNFELTFCGLSLEDEKPLSSYGVTSGVTIHATEKVQNKPENNVEPHTVTKPEVQQFLAAFMAFKLAPSHRSTLHRLENATDVEEIIGVFPELRDDPVALAFITKPDFINQMEEDEVCQKIAEKNPLILRAVQYIITEFHKKTTQNGTNSLPPPPTSGYSYSLDALSDDDDDMDGDNGGASTSGAPITAAQLAAAIAAASSAPQVRITPEMLQHALSPTATSTRYASQLRQMRELGMHDEGRNVRALTAAAGDVQAAIDLLFSGAFDD